jgi:hypothetical protein
VINFRFHLISLIAVFLALAVGVVMGYGVLGQPTVDTLQSRIDHVEARANRIKSENNELKDEIRRLSTAMEDVASFAVGAAPGHHRGPDRGTRSRRGQGRRHRPPRAHRDEHDRASVPGVIWLEEKWGLDNAETRRSSRRS